MIHVDHGLLQVDHWRYTSALILVKNPSSVTHMDHSLLTMDNNNYWIYISAHILVRNRDICADFAQSVHLKQYKRTHTLVRSLLSVTRMDHILWTVDNWIDISAVILVRNRSNVISVVLILPCFVIESDIDVIHVDYSFPIMDIWSNMSTGYKPLTCDACWLQLAIVDHICTHAG